MNARRLARAFCAFLVVSFAVQAPLIAQVTVDAVDTDGRSPFSSWPAPQGISNDIWALPAVEFGQIIKAPAGPPPTPRHTGLKALVKGVFEDAKHLPSRQNLFWLGVGSGLALAAHPFDDNVQRFMVDNHTAKNIFEAGAVLGQAPTLLGAAAAIYATGRLRDQPKVSHIGMDLIQALALSAGMTQVLKTATRRERPDGSSRNSFPSGHASGTFAFATALERHLGWRFAVPAYAFSSYVAISRLPANRHWLSDAIFGSAVGIIAGRTVTRHGRENFPVQITAVPGGAAIVFVGRSSP